jgi:hypothetical protein
LGIVANQGISQGVKRAGGILTKLKNYFEPEFKPGIHALGTAVKDTGHAAGWVWDHTLGGLF